MNNPKRCGWLVGISLLLVLSACQGETSVLNPQGEGAKEIANLWIVMLIFGAVVYLQVILFVGIALFRRRRAANANILAPPPLPDISRPSRGEKLFIAVNGIAIPIVILIIVFGFNLVTLAALSSADTNPELRIEVIGHRWWWEVRYPNHDIVTANEIHIPTGTQVEVRLASVDVIHSLWIPTLNGKADMIPGQTNTLYLHTDEAGEHHGVCAELCGIQHAWMHFHVVAQPMDDFEEWIANQQQPAPIPQNELTLRGQQIFLGAACVYCHTIRGTTATGVIGPDLTHFGSRSMLGAGVLPNTRANLAGWIIDSQSIKPGNEMPPIYLEGDDLQALLAYFETLQ